jgi:hypothetical protein
MRSRSSPASELFADESFSSFLEGELDAAYISAFSALAGALIGGLTSFATSWFTQRAQILNAHREAEKAKLEALYSDFIAEAARVMGDALTHQTDDVTALMQLYALVGRMRLVSDRTVIDAAVRIEEAVMESYLGPNRTLSEVLVYAHRGGAGFLTEFGEAARKDLAARVAVVR